MKLKELSLPDEVYEAYEKQAEELQAVGKSVSPQELIAAQVEKFAQVKTYDRILIIDPKTRSRLEELLSGGSINEPADLLKKVEFLASLEIGGVRLDFTPPQWNQLKRYAGKNARSLEETVRTVVTEIGWRFFDHLPS